MSTDSELLELAANAAGLGWRWFGANFCIDKDKDMGTFQPWNPLTDDGDAFRLAVTLRLDIEHGNEALAVNSRKTAYEDTPYATTRRAIVLCAAEIGRSLK